MKKKKRIEAVLISMLSIAVILCGMAVYAQSDEAPLTYDGELERLLADYNAVRSELLLLAQEYERLKAAYDGLMRECDKDGRQHVEARNNALERDNKQLSLNLKECQLLYLNLQEEMQNLKNKVLIFEDEVRVLEEEKKELGDRSRTLKTQHKVCELQMQAALKEVKDREDSINEISILLKQKEGSLREKEKEGNQLKKELKDYADRFEIMRSEQVQLKSKLIAQDEKIQVFKNALFNLRVRRDGLLSEVEKLRAELKMRESSSSQQNGMLQQRQELITELQDTLAQRQDTIVSLQGELAEQGTALSKLGDEYQACQSQKSEFEALSRQKQEETEALRAKYDDLIKLREPKEKTQPAAGDKARLSAADAEQKMAHLSAENQALKRKLNEYTQKFGKAVHLKERLMKENAVLHYNMGVIYLQQYDYENAVKEFQKAIELNPKDPATHYNLGLIYAEYLDDKAKAISHFKRYLELDPVDADADKAKKYILTWETWVEEPLHMKH